MHLVLWTCTIFKKVSHSRLPKDEQHSFSCRLKKHKYEAHGLNMHICLLSAWRNRLNSHYSTGDAWCILHLTGPTAWIYSCKSHSSDIWKCCSHHWAVRKRERAQLTVTEAEWSSVCAILTTAPSQPVIQLTTKATAAGCLRRPSLTVCLCST